MGAIETFPFSSIGLIGAGLTMDILIKTMSNSS